MRRAACLALLLTLGGLGAARGGELTAAQMGADMHHYFANEKREGIAFMSLGFPALAAGGALVAQDNGLMRGAAYPLLAIGLIEAGAGLVVYFRTDRQVAGLDRQLAQAPRAYQREELARMHRVNANFRLLEAVEVGLALGGASLATAGGLQRQDTLEGVGIGLAVQSTVMLVLDLLAARRALRYMDSLLRF